MPRGRHRNVIAGIAAENLQRHRYRVGISVAELADRSGVNARTIHRIEAGSQHDPRVSTVRKLATALDIRAQDLLLTDEDRREVAA